MLTVAGRSARATRRVPHDEAPYQEEDARGEQEVYPPRGIGGDREAAPRQQHRDGGEQCEIHAAIYRRIPLRGICPRRKIPK